MRKLLQATWIVCLAMWACGPLSAATIFGRVTDADSGMGVAGVSVSVSIPLVAGGVSTVSAADGSYSMEFNQTGDANLRAIAAGYLEFSRIIGVPGTGQSLNEDIALETERFITGRLLDADSGLPLTGRAIRVYTPSGEFAGEQLTDGSGRFVFAALQNRTYAVCVLDSNDEYLNQCWDGRHAQFLSPLGQLDFTPVLPSVDSGTEQIVMSMQRGASLRGRLVDRLTGQGIAHGQARIVLYDGQGQRMDGVSTPITDVDGGFLIEGLLQLPHHLSAGVQAPYYTHSVYPGVDCDESSCNALDGAVVIPTTDVSVSLPPFALYPGGSIHGRVIKADSGDGFEGVEMTLFQASFIFWLPVDQTVTAADGSYRFDHRPSSQYRVATNTRSAWINQVAPGGPCLGNCGTQTSGGSLLLGMNEALEVGDIALTLGAAIHGQAHQPGLSAGTHRVTLFDEQGIQRQSKTADLHGRFQFDAWLPGTYYAQSSDLFEHCERYMGFACTGAPVTDATPILLTTAGDVVEITFGLPVEIIQLDGFE
ncbi:MAG: carboxypeptidase regulatory-like domain-containing protein [Xanthomonadales bacterium]|nr:carboxypeptidase regulatory-like domain-containing protein [Xanthomonadales bacterium]MCB1634926.1 carboxypeptidase regulatory-like domain-containing protein [Xanthomonadales bacterium]